MQAIVVIEGISAGRYYAEEALRRGFTPVNILPKQSCTETYGRLREASVAYWDRLGCKTLMPEDSTPEAMLGLARALSPVAIVAGSGRTI